jgi:GlpG protein
MRLIGNLPSEAEANTFAAYLLTQSIECHVESDGQNAFDVWVKDEDGFEKAKAEIVDFRADPNGEKYRKAVTEASKIEEAAVAKQQQYRKNIRQGTASAQKGIFETAPLTMVLVLICVVVSLLTEFGSSKHHDRAVARALQFVSVDAPSEELQQSYAENPDSMDVRLASIFRGELWRTISPIFYHYGTFHLVFNMLWLVQLGRMIEARYGTLCLAMIVVFSAIFSNVLQGVVPGDVGGSVPFLGNGLLISICGGMSGVIYALFGFIWFRMLYDPNSRMYLPQSTVIILIGWLFYCMVVPQIGGSFGGSGSVANWAHGGGMVMGLLLGLSPIGKRFGK